jgi:malate permease and related proteins
MFSEVFTVIGPVFTMVVLGFVLRRMNLIDEAFIATSSDLSFRLLMPSLLFFAILGADLDTAFQPKLVAYFFLATTLSFGIAWLWSICSVERKNRGVFVQGAFRGNGGIVGLALAANYYGDYGLSVGGVMNGLGIFLFNIFSIGILAFYSESFETNLRSVIKSLVTNPLLIGVMGGLLGSYLNLELPTWLMTSGEYLGALALPLALIGIGGSLTLTSLRSGAGVAFRASLWKVFVSPILLTLLAALLGFEGRELGILFLFLASPTAAASYVLTRAAKGDEMLAASIIAMTTVMSVITIFLGLVALPYVDF